MPYTSRRYITPYQSQSERDFIADLIAGPKGSWQRGLAQVAPFFGKYGRVMMRNPFAVESEFNVASVNRPELGELDWLEREFDPEHFAAGLSPFERGENPRAFTSRQRRIFR